MTKAQLIRSNENDFTQLHEKTDNSSMPDINHNNGVTIKRMKTSFIETLEEEGIRVDTTKVQKKFQQQDSIEDVSICAICQKNVYQMEKMKAEKKSFHKSCFRCKQCSKQLNVDNYNSHEGELYCQMHFKLLLQPKPNFDNRNDTAPRDSKLDDGLGEIQVDLSNIRQRFELAQEENQPFTSIADRCALQRSESLSVRLQRYQSAVSGERKMSELERNSSCDDLSDNEGENGTGVSPVNGTGLKETVPFVPLSSLKSQWESGSVANQQQLDETDSKEVKDDDTKEELYKLRKSICLGRSASMRKVYESGTGSELVIKKSEEIIESRIKAVSLKEKFEKGEIENETEEDKREILRREVLEDLSVVNEAETASRDAKNLFKQLDSNAAVNTQPIVKGTVPARQERRIDNMIPVNENRGEVIKASEPGAKEQVVIETKQLQERYKFFEQYQESTEQSSEQISRNGPRPMTPPRELEHQVDGSSGVKVEVVPDANIIRSVDMHEEIPKIETTSKMLSVFKQLETQANEVKIPDGPKQIKRITPPREFTKETPLEHETSPERDPNIVRSSYKSAEDIPVQPKLARSLTAKFEKWSSSEVEKENRRNSLATDEDDQLPQLDITKNLRAKFETIKDDYINSPVEKVKPRVNRFVNEIGNGQNGEACHICNKRLYPMEKLEFSGMKMHKNCFRCSHCHSALRLENYTSTHGKLFCISHFKQLFMSKGNYEEGFGVEQHKTKWINSSQGSRNNTPDFENVSNDECDDEPCYEAIES